MQYLTSGESHGKKLNIIIEGAPYGVSLSEEDINYELKRRSKGPGRSVRQDIEKNICSIISGISNNKTTGNPICVEIANPNFDDFSDDYSNNQNNDEKFIPRPGHADLNGVMKYNMDDYSEVAQRASARETAARVVAGVVAKNILVELGCEVYSYVVSIGSISIEENNTLMSEHLPKQADIAISKVLCPDMVATQEILSQIERAKKAGDTLGGSFKIIATGVLPGLGSYSQGYERIDSKLAASIVSVPSVKSVEFGNIEHAHVSVGSSVVDQIHHDPVNGSISRITNYSGGIEGGLTNGMPIVIKAAAKPIPTTTRPLKTINLQSMEDITNSSKIRSDTCVVPNVAIICENEVAWVLANEYLRKFGNDSMNDIKYAVDAYKQRLKTFK